MEQPTIAVVLAAGKGTRMRSDRAKVLHEAAGRPLLGWVLDAAGKAGCDRCAVVVGHQADAVRAAFVEGGGESGILWVEQAEQLGTGHALQQAVAAIEGPARLLILSGDVPAIRAATLEALLERAGAGWAVTVADVAEPGGLGRVKRGAGGKLLGIVEARDASEEELALSTINAGVYVAPKDEIAAYLDGLVTANAQGELYLTDAFSSAAADGVPVALFDLADESEAWGVNDRADLARAHRILSNRRCAELMERGVTILDPERTVVEAEVQIGRDSVVHEGVSLLGRTTVGERATIESGAWLRDSSLGDEVVIGPVSVLEGATVESRAKVGPFARLRPGTVVGADSKIGNFVEIKNSRLAPGVKAGHLAYLGDAVVGSGANIGAGTVTCNYDGKDKHRTEIGEEAFIGSDTMLVAPVRVGDGASTGAGSVITQDVPDGSLGVGRARQRNVDGWRRRQARREDAAAESTKSPSPPSPPSPLSSPNPNHPRRRAERTLCAESLAISVTGTWSIS